MQLTRPICPSCRAVLEPFAKQSWRCSGCGLLAVDPGSLRAALQRLGLQGRPDVAPERQPRGACPRCEETLLPLDQEPWSMCPRCRLRVVPAAVLPVLAHDPERIRRTPLGVPSDGVGETSLNRAVRVVVAVVLCATAVMVFEGPTATEARCAAAKANRSLSLRQRSRQCEAWILRTLGAAFLLATAGGLVLSAAGYSRKRKARLTSGT